MSYAIFLLIFPKRPCLGSRPVASEEIYSKNPGRRDYPVDQDPSPFNYTAPGELPGNPFPSMTHGNPFCILDEIPLDQAYNLACFDHNTSISFENGRVYTSEEFNIYGNATEERRQRFPDHLKDRSIAAVAVQKAAQEPIRLRNELWEWYKEGLTTRRLDHLIPYCESACDEKLVPRNPSDPPHLKGHITGVYQDTYVEQ